MNARRVVRRYLELSFRRQVGAARAVGLVSAADLRESTEEIARRVFARAREHDLLDALAAAIEEEHGGRR